MLQLSDGNRTFVCSEEKSLASILIAVKQHHFSLPHSFSAINRRAFFKCKDLTVHPLSTDLTFSQSARQAGVNEHFI